MTNEVLQLPLSAIKPDPKQPRTIFSNKDIKDLAESMQQNGLINPIEVDGEHMIITGERRWRAAKYNKWETVRVIVNKTPLTEYNRLLRQLAENMHRSGSADSAMNPVDVARAYARLIFLKTGKHYYELRKENRYIEVTKDLAIEVGVTTATVRDNIDILDQPEPVMNAIALGIPRTYFQEAREGTGVFGKQITDKIINGDYISRDEIRQDTRVVQILPDLAKVQLERIRSLESTQTNKVLNSIVILALALQNNPLPKINPREKEIVKKQLQWLQERIDAYFIVPLEAE